MKKRKLNPWAILLLIISIIVTIGMSVYIIEESHAPPEYIADMVGAYFNFNILLAIPFFPIVVILFWITFSLW